MQPPAGGSASSPWPRFCSNVSTNWVWFAFSSMLPISFCTFYWDEWWTDGYNFLLLHLFRWSRVIQWSTDGRRSMWNCLFFSTFCSVVAGWSFDTSSTPLEKHAQTQLSTTRWTTLLDSKYFVVGTRTRPLERTGEMKLNCLSREKMVWSWGQRENATARRGRQKSSGTEIPYVTHKR